MLRPTLQLLAMLALAGLPCAARAGLSQDASPEALSPTAGPSGFRLTQTLALPGAAEGGFPTLDNSTRNLFVADGDRVLVVDVTSNSVVAQVSPFGAAQGVALVPDMNHGYVSDGKADQVVCFNLNTLALMARISVGGDPGTLLSDHLTSRVFAFNNLSSSASVIELGSTR